MEWKEFKQIIPEYSTVKIEPTDIMVGVLNFTSGNVDRYKFKAEYVSRDGGVLWNHDMYVRGVITYESGASYNNVRPLSYTDSEELDKLADAMRKAEPRATNEMWGEMRKY